MKKALLIFAATAILLVLLLMMSGLKKSPEFLFVGDFIESLGCQRDALKRYHKIPPPRPGNPKESQHIGPFLSNLELSHADLKKAKALISKYKDSENVAIRKVCASVLSLYDKQVRLSERSLKLYRTIYNPQEFESMGDYAQGKLLAETRALPSERENLDKTLADLSILVTHVLYSDRLDKEGKMSYLTVTSAERKKLLARLNELFNEGGQTPLQPCAENLKGVLAGAYKASDQR